jgi:protein TonB
VCGAVRDRQPMTVTIKDNPEMKSGGTHGAPSQNSENKAGHSPRSNPVCLEVALTIRSLPNEPGGITKPIREECKTVIVFDNGAVIRSTSNLPVGQTVILSNAGGRDVVCKVVGGRSLPSVKGYVEVEFIEPVNDFWRIHQDSGPTVTAPPPINAVAPREVRPPAAAPFITPPAANRTEASAEELEAALGSGPSFEDIDGLISMPSTAPARDAQTPAQRSSAATKKSEATNPSTNGDIDSDALARSLSSVLESPAPVSSAASAPGSAKRANSAPVEAASNASQAPRDFMTKGLMAYEKPQVSASNPKNRTQMIVGIAAVALVGVGAIAFLFMRKSSAPEPAMNMAVLTRPTTPSVPAMSATPAAATAPTQDTAPSSNPAQAEPQPVAADRSQLSAANAAVPAVVTGPVNSDPRTDSATDSRNSTRSARRDDKTAAASKPAETAPPRQPTISNLKMGTPSAPNRNLSSLGDGSAPMTEIAATGSAAGSTSAGLLTSSGRTSVPPTAPPQPPAPPVAKVIHDPKLLTSPRLEYPPAARQANIEGTVTVYANVDAEGRVTSAKALSGPMLLRQAAVESVQQWKYAPGTIDGKPSPSQLSVNVDFRLH